MSETEDRILSDIVWTPERGPEAEVRSISWNNLLLSDELFGGKFLTSSEIRINPDTALQSTVLLACSRLIAESVAGLPLRVYRRLKDGHEEVADDIPLARVLGFAPNGWQTKFEFLEQLVQSVTLWGNSYTEIKSGRYGSVTELNNLHPSRMRVERLENGRLKYSYNDPQTGRLIQYTQDQIMHVRWTPEPDGVKGMMPVEIARDAIALSRACEIYASKFWANMGRPGVVLQTEGSLSAETAERLRDNWERLHRGVHNAYKTAVLTNGLKVESFGATNTDSQYLEVRKFQCEEISRCFRIPLHLIQGQSGSGNLEVQGQEFVTYTLMPWLTRIEQAISRSLIYDDATYFAKFDVRGLLRGDSVSRASYFSTMMNLGIFSVNEVRRMEGLGPLGKEADTHLVAMNLQPLEEAVKPKPDPSQMPGAGQGAPPPAPGVPPSLSGVKPGKAPMEAPKGEVSEKKSESRELTPQDAELEEAQDEIAAKEGKWEKDSAHYVYPNPFAGRGIKCANCTHYSGDGACDVVEGTIDPDAICKLWVIPQEKISADPEKRAFCATGTGGGIKNDCGSGEGGGGGRVDNSWKTAGREYSYAPSEGDPSPIKGGEDIKSLSIEGPKDVAAAMKDMKVKSLTDVVAIGGGLTRGASTSIFSQSGEIRIDSVVPIDPNDDESEAMESTVVLSFDPEGKKYVDYRHMGAVSEAGTANLTGENASRMGSILMEKFPQSLTAAEKAGFQYATTYAMGDFDSEYKGYRIWPKFGFDAVLDTHIREKIPKDIVPHDDPVTIQQLIATPAGDRWWNENGESMAMMLNFKDKKSDGYQRYQKMSALAERLKKRNEGRSFYDYLFGEERAYCATGPGGGIKNDCGSKDGGGAETQPTRRESKTIKDEKKRAEAKASVEKLMGEPKGNVPADHELLINKLPFRSIGKAKNSDFVSVPADDRLKEAMKSSDAKWIGAHRNLDDGTPVAFRIDIPTFNNTVGTGKPVYAVTIHEDNGKGGSSVGDRIGYDGIARMSGPVSFTTEGKEKNAMMIAAGVAGKNPIATVKGGFDPKRSVPKDIDVWTPVGYDPQKTAYFYDKRNGREVTSGTDVVSVGNTVFTRQPKYGTRNAKTHYRSAGEMLSVGSWGLESRVYCATGEGGGVRPDCKANESGGPENPKDSGPQHAPTRAILDEILRSIDKTGGFSVSPITAESPTTGFMCATVPGAEKIIDGKEKVTEKVIDDYFEQHKAFLSTQPKLHLGGWINLKNGKVYLDLSERFETQKEAEDAAIKHNQIAIWDIANKKEIRINHERSAQTDAEIRLQARRDLEGHRRSHRAGEGEGHEGVRRGSSEEEFRSDDGCGRVDSGEFGPGNKCQENVGEGGDDSAITTATKGGGDKDIKLGNVRRQDVMLRGGKSTAVVDQEAKDRAQADRVAHPLPDGAPAGSTADLYDRNFVTRGDPSRPSKITEHDPVFADSDLAQNDMFVSHDAVARYLSGRHEEDRRELGGEGPNAEFDTRVDLTPGQFEYVVSSLKTDTDRAYQDGRHPGFYSTDIAECMHTMSGLYPELSDPAEAAKRGTTPEDAAFVFRMITAITSNGTDPALNLESADALYRLYRDHGSVRTNDTIMGGERAKEIKRSLNRFQAMIDEFGEARVRRILSGITHASSITETMKKLARQSKEIGGSWSEKGIGDEERKDEVIPVAAIFGPKIGSFYANLSGKHDFLTMDRWLMRSVGRVTGELLSRSTPTQANKQANTAIRAIKAMPRSRDLLFGLDKSPLALNRDKILKSLELQARSGIIEEDGAAYEWARAAQRAYSKVPKGYDKDGKPYGSYGEHPDPQIRAAMKVGNTIAKSLIHEQQDPRSATARRVLRGVFKEVANRIDAENPGRSEPVKVSEVQAVLWQYEQNLWKRIGAKTKIEGDSLYSAAATNLKQRRDAGEKLRELTPEKPGRPKSVRSYDPLSSYSEPDDVDNYQNQSGQDLWDTEIETAEVDLAQLLASLDWDDDFGSEARAYCPTGPGGGIKNDCPPGESSEGVAGPSEPKPDSGVKYGDRPEEIKGRLDKLGTDMSGMLSMTGTSASESHVFVRRDTEKPQEGGVHVEVTRDVAGVKDGLFSVSVIRNAGTADHPEVVVDHKTMEVSKEIRESPEKRHAAAREFFRTMTDSVDASLRSGVSKVVLNAAGSASGKTTWKGYTIWPRMGFDAPIPFHLKQKLPESLAHCNTLLDLHATPEGTKWWKQNGTDIDVQMDLKNPSSPQMQVFARFKSHFMRDRRDLPYGTGDDWLSPADLVKLDELWDEIWDDGILDDYSGSDEDFTQVDRRAFCATGEGNGIDNSCGANAKMAPDTGGGSGGSMRWGGKTEKWGKSADTEIWTPGKPLFPGAENLASIKITRPNDVRGQIEDGLKMTISDAVLASGPIIKSVERAGITMPRLEITPSEFGGISMHWTSMGAATGEGFKGEDKQYAAKPGTAVKAAEAARDIRVTKSGIVLHMGGFFIHPDFQGKGIALDSVLHSTSAPVSRLEMEAERFDHPNPNMRLNGYSAWVNFGYDAPMSKVLHVLSGRGVSLPEEYAGAKTLAGVYALPGGADFWKKNGGSISLTFDTRPRSQGREILLELRDRKNKRSEGRYVENNGIGVDSDFDPVLDEIWADIQSGKLKLTGTVPTQEEWDQWESERNEGGAKDGHSGEVQPH